MKKTRKTGMTRTIRPGDAWREIERTGRLRGQIEDERARHRIANQKLAARRSAAALRKDPERRAAEMALITAAAAEEDRRHKAKISDLTSKINKRPGR